MALKISDVIRALESFAPSGTAESWDNVGLLVGDPGWETQGAVVSVDLTQEAIDAAVKKGYRLIVNHHPCIFPKGKGLSQVVASGSSSLVFQALQKGVAVAAYHTNFDRCALEVVETISGGLGLQPRGRLIDKPSGSLLKLVVFVPESHVDAVRDAICAAGAGKIGNYDSCSFSAAGEGTFRGDEGTDPFLGKPGRLEKALERRLETIFPRGLQKPVLQALFSAHPYEEIAYDLIAVEQGPSASGLTRGLGYGFWGDFPRPRSFSDVMRDVRSLFKLEGFWVTNSASRSKRIQRVGFAAGKGADFISAASAAGCDLFITGEAGYHTALDGARRGMTVLELGHRESERFFITTMKGWLAGQGLRTVELHIPTQKIWLGD